MLRISTRLIATFVLALASPALAEEPTAEQVEQAGQEFNEGRKAFKDEDFEVAAEHFERADALAPNAQVLLNAIVARMQADELPRAATLAALAATLYPDDEELSVVVEQVTNRAGKELLDVIVECPSACTLLVESRLIHGAPATGRRVFLPPGTHNLRAQFSGGESSKKEVTGEAGESVTISFDAPEASDSRPFAMDSGSSDGDDSVGENDPMEEPTYYHKQDVAPTPKDEGGGLHPAFFFVGTAVTVGLAGTSIWSGVDTQQNPGRRAVEEACEDQGPMCPEYQLGKSKETRTNVLWGVTGGMAIATVLVGLLATDWGSDEAEADKSARARPGVRPWFAASDTGAALGAMGRF